MSYYVLALQNNDIIQLVRADKLEYKSEGRFAVFKNKFGLFKYEVAHIYDADEIKFVNYVSEDYNEAIQHLERFTEQLKLDEKRRAAQ